MGNVDLYIEPSYNSWFYILAVIPDFLAIAFS